MCIFVEDKNDNSTNKVDNVKIQFCGKSGMKI